jgi:ADP-ribose pyrophosphatase YjhB (NUDIX family)
MSKQPETNLSKVVSEIKFQLKDNRKAKYNQNITGAGAIIYDPINNKILVVKGPIKWSLPKGHRELGEEIHETAAREVLEETSIKIDLKSNGKSKRIMKCIYYLVVIENGEKLVLRPIDTHEINIVRWCTKDQIMRLDCNKQLKYCLKKWDYMCHLYARYYQKLKCPYQIASAEEVKSYQILKDVHGLLKT